MNMTDEYKLRDHRASSGSAANWGYSGIRIAGTDDE
jgi:hypothetical protein